MAREKPGRNRQEEPPRLAQIGRPVEAPGEQSVHDRILDGVYAIAGSKETESDLNRRKARGRRMEKLKTPLLYAGMGAGALGFIMGSLAALVPLWIKRTLQKDGDFMKVFNIIKGK